MERYVNLPVGGSNTVLTPTAPPIQPPTSSMPVEQLLAGILEALQAIYEDLQERIPTGATFSQTLTVTPATQQTVSFSPAVFSLTVVNDGPQPMQFRIQPRLGGDWGTLNATEVLTITSTKAAISEAQFRVPTGTAALRLVANP